MPEDSSLSRFTFFATVLGAGFFTVRAISPPNRTPADRVWRKDVLRFASANVSVQRSVTFVSLLVLYYAALSISPPAVLTAICPTEGTGQRNPALFTWSPITAFSFTAIALGVLLRRAAYSHLGKNFTFGLTKPHGLVTDGVYAYMRHPSYTGIALLGVACYCLFFRLDGAVACFVSPRYWPLVEVWGTLVYIGTGLLSAMGIGMRVVEEEAMLKELFGKKWEQWHVKTKRFIPGVI